MRSALKGGYAERSIAWLSERLGGAYMTVEAVILAAGLGTRLGRPYPKPLTPLRNGEPIIRRQIRTLRDAFGDDLRITVVVGYKLHLLVEANPDVAFVYNEVYDQTNTAPSLLKALRHTADSAVLWMNGDVVFDEALVGLVRKSVGRGQSFVAVDVGSPGDEEVKYNLDEDGHIRQLSKSVVDARGEALGINFISSADKSVLVRYLAACADHDYFERGIELAIQHERLQFLPIDVGAMACVEVDDDKDLHRANTTVVG